VAYVSGCLPTRALSLTMESNVLHIAGSILSQEGISVTSMLRSHLVLTELELAFVSGIPMVRFSWQKLSVFHVFTRLMLVKH